MKTWQFSLKALVLVTALTPIAIGACVTAWRVYRELREQQAYFLDGVLLIFLLVLGVSVARAVICWPRPPF